MQRKENYKTHLFCFFCSLFNGAAKIIKDGKEALEFDGVNDYATTPSVNFRTTDFTLAFWINPRAYNFVILFSCDKESSRQFVAYIYVSQSVAFQFFNVDRQDIIHGFLFPVRYVR